MANTPVVDEPVEETVTRYVAGVLAPRSDEQRAAVFENLHSRWCSKCGRTRYIPLRKVWAL